MNHAAPPTRSAEHVWPGILSMLVHDLRTPLSSIILNLELLGQGGPGLTVEQREDIEYALTSARALAEMLKGVSDLAHLTGGNREIETGDVDVSKLTAAAAAAAKPDADEGPEVVVEPGAGVHAWCNSEITRRVLREMVAQAVAVTTQGDPVRVSVVSEDGKVRVEVVDGGTTIPEEFADRVFDLAGTLELRDHRRALSRGIGPTVWRLAARAQGGDAGTRPASGGAHDRGNVFWIELPTRR